MIQSLKVKSGAMQIRMQKDPKVSMRMGGYWGNFPTSPLVLPLDLSPTSHLYLPPLFSSPTSLLTSTSRLPAGHDELCLPPYLPRELTPNLLVTAWFDILLTQFYLTSEFNTQLLRNCRLLSPQTYPGLLGIKWYITSRIDHRRKSAGSKKVLFLFPPSFLSDFLSSFLSFSLKSL